MSLIYKLVHRSRIFGFKICYSRSDPSVQIRRRRKASESGLLIISSYVPSATGCLCFIFFIGLYCFYLLEQHSLSISLSLYFFYFSSIRTLNKKTESFVFSLMLISNLVEIHDVSRIVTYSPHTLHTH